MKKPKKPTLRKLPKAPKMDASKSVWDNFESKAKEIKSENDKKTKAFNTELKKYETEKARRQKLKSKF